MNNADIATMFSATKQITGPDRLLALVILSVMMSVFCLFAATGTSYAQTPDSSASALSPDSSRKGTLPHLYNENDPDKKPSDILNIIAQFSPLVQEEFMEEGDKAFKYCKDNFTLSRYYDCSCYAFQFMEARYLEGPEEHFYGLTSKTNKAPCVFAPLVAGTNYERCNRLLKTDDDLDEDMRKEVCSCVSRRMLADFESRPTTDASAIDNRFTDKLISCNREIKKSF